MFSPGVWRSGWFVHIWCGGSGGAQQRNSGRCLAADWFWPLFGNTHGSTHGRRRCGKYYMFWLSKTRSGKKKKWNADSEFAKSCIILMRYKPYSEVTLFSNEILKHNETNIVTAGILWNDKDMWQFHHCLGHRIDYIFRHFLLPFLLKGGALGRYVQRKLSDLKIFEESFVSLRETLRMAVAICEQWVVACEHLTGQVWIGQNIWTRS